MNTQIYDEASEWIILHRTDTLDADAKRRFDTWLRESPQHLKAYLEMSTIWEEVPALNCDWNPNADELIARAREDNNVVPLNPHPPADVSPSLSPDVERGKNEFESQQRFEFTNPQVSTSSSRPEHKGVRSTNKFVRVLSIAATVLVLVCIGSWSYLQRGVYSTDIGEQRTLALTDGSTVELNARTKIRVAYTDQTRTIELLEGQALFKVAKDPNRPFVVGSDGTRVRAVGTQFDVYKKSNGTQVTVVEGRVALTVPASGVLGVSGLSREVPTAHRGSAEETQGFSGSSRPPNGVDATNIGDTAPASTERASHALQVQLGEVLLSAGEQLTVSAVIPANARIQEIQSVPVPQLANIEATTAWTQQRFVFDFTPLTEVADEFNRYNRRRLIIDDPTLETFNVSGSFSSTDPTLLLRFLREQPEIVLNESATEIRISRLPDNTGP